jgi:hypothetical protein
MFGVRGDICVDFEEEELKGVMAGRAPQGKWVGNAADEEVGSSDKCRIRNAVREAMDTAVV